MSNLVFSLFGSFQVTFAGKTLDEQLSKKGCGLLAYLTVEDAPKYARSTLTGLFWPELPESNALNNLSKTLSRLQRTFYDHERELPFLVMTREYIQIHPNRNYRVDVNQFIHLLESGTIPEFEHAVALYRDELLAGFSLPDCAAFEEWMLMKREYYRRVVLDTMHTLAGYYLNTDDYIRAQQFAQRQLDLDAWREEAICQSIEALARNGQQGEALIQYETYRQNLLSELGIEPQETITLLHEQIRKGLLQMEPKASLSPSDIPTPLHNLPSQLTPLIGRERELQTICEAISDPIYRLITLTGPGGIGKTQLAFAVARQVLAQFDDGVWFIPLNEVEIEEFNELSSETTLSSTSSFHNPLTTFIFRCMNIEAHQMNLFTYLQSKNLLLVFDNFEHLLARSDFILALLEAAPQVQILATSRENLHMTSEYVVRLDGLSYPSSCEDPVAAHHSSLQLFVRRAKRVMEDFTLNENNLRDVAQICQLVEGNPLAIEIAAIWVHHLTCGEIVRAINESPEFLVSTRRDHPDRHQSMQAVFTYSWQLLSEVEQLILAQLSVFRGTFSRNAALSITDASIQTLVTLAEKSLLHQPDVGRYKMHELLRQFAAEKLNLLGGKVKALFQGRHSTYYLSFAGEKAQLLYGQEPYLALTEIQAEIINIQRAYQRAIKQVNFVVLNQYVHAIASIFLLKGLIHDGEILMQQLIERVQNILKANPGQKSLIIHKVLGKAYVEQSRFLAYQMKYEKAIMAAKAAIEQATYVQNQDTEAGGYLFWGVAEYLMRHYETAQPLLRKSLSLAQSKPAYHAPIPNRGAAALEAICSYLLACVCLGRGQYKRAIKYENISLSTYRKAGDLWGMARAMHYLGKCYCHMGYYDKAKVYCEQSLQIARDVKSDFDEGLVLFELGRILNAIGNYRNAQYHVQKALSIHRKLGNKMEEANALGLLSRIICSLDEHTTALAYAQEGIQISQEIPNPNLEAFNLVGMGNALLELGRLPGALFAFQDVSRIVKNPAVEYTTLESWSGIIQVYMAENMAASALDYVEKALTYLQKNTLQGQIDLLRIYLVCYHVLDALQDDRAQEVLQTAYTLLQTWAEKIDDAELIHMFLHGIESHREILTLHQQISTPHL